MSALVKSVIATELAKLSRVNDAPQAPFGFGVDLYCDGDVAADWRDATDPRTVLAQALLRRLDCPRGQLPDDPNYGLGIRGHVAGPMTPADTRSLSGAVRLEMQKDPRVAEATARVDANVVAGSLRIQVRIVPRGVAEPFDLIFAVTDAAVTLEALS